LAKRKKAVEEKFNDFCICDSIWIENLDGKNRGPIRTIELPKEILLLKHYQNYETIRNGYLKGLALDSIQTNYNDRNCHYYGRELMMRGYYKTAIEIFKNILIEMVGKQSKPNRLIFMGDWLQKTWKQLKRRKNVMLWHK